MQSVIHNQANIKPQQATPDPHDAVCFLCVEKPGFLLTQHTTNKICGQTSPWMSARKATNLVTFSNLLCSESLEQDQTGVWFLVTTQICEHLRIVLEEVAKTKQAQSGRPVSAI